MRKIGTWLIGSGIAGLATIALTAAPPAAATPTCLGRVRAKRRNCEPWPARRGRLRDRQGRGRLGGRRFGRRDAGRPRPRIPLPQRCSSRCILLR
jgi:hypothetical protein